MKERKANRGPTPAQILLEGRKLLTERPEEMTYAEYKVMRRYQNVILGVILKKPSNNKILQAMGVRQGYNFHPRIIKPPTNDTKE